MSNTIKEIRLLISDLGGHIDLDLPIIVKNSPHSHPIKIYSISSTDDFDSMKTEVINTIYQRLKWINHEQRKKAYNKDI